MIIDFKNEGYNFNHIAEMNFITIANKLDMLYDLYVGHNMLSGERKLIDMIIKNKNLINKLNRNLITKFNQNLYQTNNKNS